MAEFEKQNLITNKSNKKHLIIYFVSLIVFFIYLMITLGFGKAYFSKYHPSYFILYLSSYFVVPILSCIYWDAIKKI